MSRISALRSPAVEPVEPIDRPRPAAALTGVRPDDREAAALYEAFGERVRGYVRFRVRDQGDADDLVGDVFQRVVSGPIPVEPAARPAWIFRVAHNVVVDHYRRRRFPLLPAFTDRADDAPSLPDRVIADERMRVTDEAMRGPARQPARGDLPALLRGLAVRDGRRRDGHPIGDGPVARAPRPQAARGRARRGEGPMTTPGTTDLLDLAEAVAEGRLRPEDAERQLGALPGQDRAAETDEARGAIRDLHRLIAATEAVRAHAAATRATAVVEPLATALEPKSVEAVLPSRSAGARVVRRRQTLRGEGGAPRRTWLLVAAMLLVGSALAAASVVGGRPTTPSPVPSLPASVADASATPAPTSTLSATPGFVMPAGLTGAVTGMRLASPTVGWIATATALYRSGDMGATWTQLRPPGASGSGQPFFIDADTTYIVHDGRPESISATHDGGKTWVQVTIDAPTGSIGPLMTFRSPSKAFATFIESETASDRLLIYATTDGGGTWTGPVHATAPSLTPGFNKIQGAGGNALWLSDGKADNVPFDEKLALSSDGGATWTDGSFPIDDVAIRGDLKWPLAVLADDGGHFVMAIAVGDDKTDPQVLYDSTDDARSWRFIRSWPQPYFSDIDVQFLSPTTWVLVPPDGSEIWSTTDAGAHWRATAGTKRIWLSTTFGSPDQGWAEHQCLLHGRKVLPGPDPWCDGTGVDSVLLATTDGGKTWVAFGD